MFRASSFLFLAAMLAIGGPVSAQTGRDQGRSITTNLPRPILQAMRDWLRDNRSADTPEFPFKVPGETVTQLICDINPEGIRCYERLLSIQCPTSVVVRTGSGTTIVPVTCTGPDADGNCDCEFRER